MQKNNIISLSLTKLGVEVAFGHLGHIILVQEFTLVAFLAQSPQPVLAHDCLFTLGVSERAVGAFVTCGLHEELTHSRSRFCLEKW